MPNPYVTAFCIDPTRDIYYSPNLPNKVVSRYNYQHFKLHGMVFTLAVGTPHSSIYNADDAVKFAEFIAGFAKT